MVQALCQICGESIHEDRVYCSKCHAPHHQDCWDFNGGCSIFACGGQDCRRQEPTAPSGSQVLYIDDDRESLRPPAPVSQRSALAVNWAAIVSIVAICFVRSLQTDPHPYRPSSPGRPGVLALHRERPRCQVPPPLCHGRPLGIAQTVRDLPGLPRGELIYLFARNQVTVPIPGVNIRGYVRYRGRTETGRLVNLGPNDFEMVMNPADIPQPYDASAILRALRMSVVPGTFPHYVILIDPASQSGDLEAGTLVKVDRVESGSEGPISYHGLSGSNEVTVPAASCRPVLATALRSELHR